MEPAPALTRELQAVPGHPYTTFGALLTDFLGGHGVPHNSSHSLRDQQIIKFSDNDVDDAGFRARMFHRAATGMDQTVPRQRIQVSNLIPSTKQTKAHLCLQVSFVAPGLGGREGLSTGQRAALLGGDMIACRTCLGQVFIPASSILRLLRHPNEEDPTFTSPTEAVTTWLFHTILASVGGGLEGIP